MAKGYIYIMTNPALKDMVKIGYASVINRLLNSEPVFFFILVIGI